VDRLGSSVSAQARSNAIDTSETVHRVQQKSFLKVDERGTEAAAATFVELVIICGGCGPESFVFDRPFLLAIRERLTGTVLFVGVIGDPTKG
jgi:serine protease inhibitor